MSENKGVDMPRHRLGWMSLHCDSVSQESKCPQHRDLLPTVNMAGSWGSGDRKLPHRVSPEGHSSWDWHGSLSHTARDDRGGP